jgi:hypothetical membrane protein
MYDGYSPFSQAISELGSSGAPTRPAILAVLSIYALLLLAFGIGVRQAAQGNRALRLTGDLLIVYALTVPIWFPFPLTARGEMEAAAADMPVTDTMHMVLGLATYLLTFAFIGVGAAALGRRFRVYSVATIVTVLVFSAATFAFVPRVMSGEPTAWLGVVERISLWAWLLWIAVLAVSLLKRAHPRSIRPSLSGPDTRPGQR